MPMAKRKLQDEMVKRIEIDHFTNKMALDLAMKILKVAQSKNQHIAIEISRLNHTIFKYLDDTLPMDKHNWLRRKANVARHFEESSLSVKCDLEKKHMTLDKSFGLDGRDYLAKGGAIPIFVKNVGMVATITVSGLSDVEDHDIIVEALNLKDK